MSNVDISFAPASPPKFGEPRTATVAGTAEREATNWMSLSIGVAILAIAYGPLLWMFFRQQWQKPHYQYFPFVFAAFGWLLWKRFGEAAPKRAEIAIPSWTDQLLQIGAVLLLLFGLWIRSPWFAMISLIVLAASMLLAVSRTRTIVNLWGIWILLWLVVPAPLNWDQQLITRLQSVSSRLSSSVLDALGIYHMMDGNTLWLRSKQLFVDEACSGIISMLSIVACAVIYSVYKNRSPLHLVLLAAGSIAWTTLLNVVRISTIAYILDKYGVDWSYGTPHEMISLVLFLVACLALLCTDQILLGCLGPVASEWNGELRFGRRLAAAWDWLINLGPTTADDRENRETAQAPPPPPALLSRRRAFGWFLPAIFAPMAAIQCALLAYAFARAPERLPAVQAGLQLAPQDLPSTISGLHKTDFKPARRSADNIQGKYSRTYFFRSDDGTDYMLSFDFPFPGMWHELTECYTANGWKPIERQVASAEIGGKSGEPWKYVEATFMKSGGRFGALCFSEFDQYGTPYEPQTDWYREGSSFWASRNLYLKERQIFQVQVWFEGTTKATAEQQKKARELLLEARSLIRGFIMDRSQPMVPSTPAENAGKN